MPNADEFNNRFSAPTVQTFDDMIGLSLTLMRDAYRDGQIEPGKAEKVGAFFERFDSNILNGKSRRDAIKDASAHSGLPVNI